MNVYVRKRFGYSFKTIYLISKHFYLVKYDKTNRYKVNDVGSQEPFNRVRMENPGKFLKPWKPLEKPLNFFIKPWKISQNFIEKINSRNGAFC